MPTPSPEAVTIRPVDSGDARTLAALHVESWRSAYRGLLRDDYLDGAIELLSNFAGGLLPFRVSPGKG